MAYTQNGTYFDEKTHYESRPNIVTPRSRPRAKRIDFGLNFKISEGLLKKFSETCEKNGVKKAEVTQKFLNDVMEGDFNIDKLRKFIGKDSDCFRNINIHVERKVYEAFADICRKKGYNKVAPVVKAWMMYYIELSEKVSEEVSKNA